MSAARDQVVDALWPDQDPGRGVELLNQTVYFLRRVFEPEYVEDLSPGYVRHEADLLWLDSELVQPESRPADTQSKTPVGRQAGTSIELVSRRYRGQFALDFEYEEWASGYRDNLHASYLEVIERAVGDDRTGRAIR